MLPLEHSAILLTCIKRKLDMKTKFRSYSEWPFYTGFTVAPIAYVGPVFGSCFVMQSLVSFLFLKSSLVALL